MALPRLEQDDTAYALRIVVCHLIGNYWADTTGYGLSLEDEFEEQYEPCSIDLDNKTIIYGASTLSIAQFVAVA